MTFSPFLFGNNLQRYQQEIKEGFVVSPFKAHFFLLAKIKCNRRFCGTLQCTKNPIQSLSPWKLFCSILLMSHQANCCVIHRHCVSAVASFNLWMRKHLPLHQWPIKPRDRVSKTKCKRQLYDQINFLILAANARRNN